MSELQGSCLCNKVKYIVKQDDDLPVIPEVAMCSCDDCQKQTGSAHSLTISVRRKNLTWVDLGNVLKVYSRPAEEGRFGNQRYFCGNCGSSFAQFSDHPGAADVSWFTIGTLDRHIKMKLTSPTIEVFGKSRLPLTTENVAGKRFNTFPGHAGGE